MERYLVDSIRDQVDLLKPHGCAEAIKGRRRKKGPALEKPFSRTLGIMRLERAGNRRGRLSPTSYCPKFLSRPRGHPASRCRTEPGQPARCLLKLRAIQRNQFGPAAYSTRQSSSQATNYAATSEDAVPPTGKALAGNSPGGQSTRNNTNDSDGKTVRCFGAPVTP